MSDRYTYMPLSITLGAGTPHLLVKVMPESHKIYCT